MKAEWETKKLGEITKIINGGTPKTNKKEYWDGEILWITPKDLGKLEGVYVNNTSRKISEKGLNKSSAKIIPPNSVILSTRAPIGYLAINKKEITTNQGCRGIVPRENVSSKFLYYFLKKSVKLLNELGTGTTFKELSSTNLNSMSIPLPPLSEQERIVQILDQAFAAIDQALANTEKNLQNVQELFDSYLDKLFSNQDRIWEEKYLGELCLFENGDRGKNYPSRAARTQFGIPFINAGHLSDDGIDFSNMNYISRERFNLLGAGKTKPHDILFCLRGSLGKFASVGNLPEGAIASSLVIVRPGQYLLNEFLLLYFGSRVCAKMINKFSNGAAQPNLSARSLWNFSIRLPALDEQREIIFKVNTIKEELKLLQSNYQHKRTNLHELKQSILQKAFNGELP